MTTAKKSGVETGRTGHYDHPGIIFCPLCRHGLYAHTEIGCVGTKDRYWDPEVNEIVGLRHRVNAESDDVACGCTRRPHPSK